MFTYRTFDVVNYVWFFSASNTTDVFQSSVLYFFCFQVIKTLPEGYNSGCVLLNEQHSLYIQEDGVNDDSMYAATK